MTHDSTRRRWTAAGLVSMAVGSVGVVAGLALPAAAHEGKEPHEIDEPSDLSCAELADLLEIDAEWTGFKIEAGDLPAEGESQTYDVTPDDDGDDAEVTIEMLMELKNFNWSSTIGIDAVYVKGGSEGSYFYGYQPDVAGYNSGQGGEIVGPGEEATEDVDLGTPPWRVEGRNEISHVTFCYDGEGGSTTSTSSTSSTVPETPPSSECPEADLETGGMPGDETTPPSEPETPPSTGCETPTTTPPTTAPSTTASIEPDVSTTVAGDTGSTTTLAVTPQSDTLPNTGSNTTTPLIVGGLALLVVGGGLVAGNKYLRRS
jgi:LPXTG-motif cell wall-anchored protein